MTNIGHLGNGTSGSEGSNEDTQTALERRVRACIGRRVRDLAITIEGGAVTLDGRTDCFHVKQLAQAAVQAFGGLVVKVNRIRVL